MERDALGQLGDVLRDDPPSALAALTDEQLNHLTTAIRTARRRQGEALQAASAQALDRIPRLLRGPVKKIVG